VLANAIYAVFLVMLSPSKSSQKRLLLFLFILAMSISLLGHWVYPSSALNKQAHQQYQTISCDYFQQPYWNLQWSHNIFEYNAPEAQERRDYECGLLNVPEHHNKPDGKQIQLAVAIIKSTSDAPEPDPLVLLQGGPGGSGITIFSSLANSQTKGGSALRLDRDLIILEQRGTLFSKPQLGCSEVQDVAKVQFQNPNLSEASLRDYYQKSLNKCHQRLVHAGVDLTAYNSVENSADIVSLAHALGHKKINLYGVSYGSLLALQTIRNHSEILKSVIIDGVLPPQIHWPKTVPISTNKAIAKLMNACAEDIECDRAYPHLMERFKAQIIDLNQNPVFTKVFDHKNSKFQTIKFTGDDLESIVISTLYSKEALFVIPAMIDQVEHKKFDVASYLLSTHLFYETLAEGMFYSVTCAENTDFNPPDLSGLDKQTAKRNVRDLKLFQTQCRTWNVPALSPSLKDPVVSDLPILIFNGKFDPITPSPFGAMVAQTLPNSHIVTFPVEGHGALISDQCATNIAVAFLNNPQVKPKIGCLNEEKKIEFVTSNTTFKSSEALPLMQLMAYGQIQEIDLKAISILTILSALVIWPANPLIQRLWKKRAKKNSSSILGIFFALLAGILTVIWLGLQTYAVSSTAFIHPHFSFLESFVGINREYAWISIFPLLIYVPLFGMIFYTVRAWKQELWHMSWRIYYTLITLATIFYSTVMSGETISNIFFIRQS
jgi:pimeloyl-ACP methyl ester carboxylesterase